MRRFVLASCLLAASIGAPVLAGSRMAAAPLANVQLADPEQEKQARSLMETVRCLVCQGQSIADSDAEMARMSPAISASESAMDWRNGGRHARP